MGLEPYYNPGFYADQGEGSLRSARVVVPLVLDLLRPRSVVDVGCGIGTWLCAFQENGVRDVLGLDGHYVDQAALLIPPDCFRAVDLDKPFHLDRAFDLAISLEVAEHLPPECADGFTESIGALAPAILFSAALPGQKGTHHVNLQWPDYWQRLFLKRNYLMFDPLRHLLSHDARIEWWYRQNLFVFVRADCVDELSATHLRPYLVTSDSFMLVNASVLRANLGLRASMRRLPRLLWLACQKRLRRLYSLNRG